MDPVISVALLPPRVASVVSQRSVAELAPAFDVAALTRVLASYGATVVKEDVTVRVLACLASLLDDGYECRGQSCSSV
jgi:hypothetical protein